MIGKALQALNALLTRRVAFEVDLIPLEFRDLPLKKILNWLLTEGSVYVKPARPWGRPTLLQVEPTNRCNLLCQVCPVRTGMNRARGDMDFGLFRRLIDELGDYLLVIMFWDWGEPFLHAEAHEMIRYAHTRGIRVVASTNGHVFAAGDHARRVVESGLDVLVFSVDGITEESYQHYRSAGQLEQVAAGIRRVVEERHRLGRLSERSFMEIWAGEAYGSLRRAFRKHWPQVPLCGECAFGFEGGDVGRAANAEAVFFSGREGS